MIDDIEDAIDTNVRAHTRWFNDELIVVRTHRRRKLHKFSKFVRSKRQIAMELLSPLSKKRITRFLGSPPEAKPDTSDTNNDQHRFDFRK